MEKSQKLQILSTVTAGLFSGAAFYINAVEHPARMTLDIDQAHKQWKPSYTKAAKIQACLATISCLSSIANAVYHAPEDKKRLILTAGLLIGSVIPFTFAAIMPTNKILLEKNDQQFSEGEKENLLTSWGKLHAVRTIASLAAFGLMVYTIAKK